MRVTGSIQGGNAIRGNFISSNSGIGIDLGGDGVTANDVIDVDTGANGLQNLPVITSANSTNTTIAGTLNSTPNTGFTIDFFASPSCDPSGFGEGQRYIGSTVIVTGGNNGTFFMEGGQPFVAGEFVTATALDVSGNTSEFSACVVAGS